MAQWKSEIEPVYPNPFLVDDPLNSQRLAEHHRNLDTKWHKWTNEETKAPDHSRQKQAIANAFRVACLSDGKSLKDLATHYQDIHHIPYDVSDPKVYHDALENKRIAHNRSKGISDADIAHHAPYYDALRDYHRYHHAMHPHLTPSQSRERADREANYIRYTIERQMRQENPDKALDEDKITKAFNKRLKQFSKPSKTAASPFEVGPYEEEYPPYTQSSLVGLSNASRNIDALHKAALNDIENNNGEGDQFRDQVLAQQIPHIGPREASLAWNLLSPNSSQLAHIDQPTLEALEHKPEDYNTRDHNKFEHELQAGRDVSGYGFMPLNQFQKGLVDSYYGPTDYSSLRAWDPVPHYQTEYPIQMGHHEWPQWWQETKPYRDEVARDWDANIAPHYSPNQMPKISLAEKGNYLFLEIPQSIKKRLYSWAQYNLSSPLRPSAYRIKIAQFPSSDFLDQINLDGLKLSAKGLIQDNSIVFLDLSLDNLVKENLYKAGALLSDCRIPLGSSDEKIKDYPPLSFRITTSARIDDLWRISTVGPNVDNSINDPLANLPEDQMPSPGAMPSQRWVDHHRNCELCHNTGVIEMDGQMKTCPECAITNWDDQKNAPSPLDDPAVANPSPGVLNPSPALNSP